MSPASLHRAIGATLTAAVAMGLLGWSSAEASSTVTTGTVRCTITSRQPTLSARLRLNGSVVVNCNAATTLGVEMVVVEMDGTTEDRTVEVPLNARWVAVTANTPMVVMTSSVTCVSTGVGGEEFATRARLNVSGTTSPWDRTVPAVDSYAC